jgi:pimeloyl-ACP methyl ester carboxylesterase
MKDIEKHIERDIPPEGHLAAVNGMEMYYEVHGEGSPLILLHGFGGCTEVWRFHIGEFAKHYRTIPIDLRGHGWSTNPANQFTDRQAALDVCALMDHLGIDQFKAIGHSVGGNTLIHVATQQPERVEAMVLIGATNYFTEEVRELCRGVPENLSAERWEWLRANHKHGEDQVRALMTQLHNRKDSYDDTNFTPPFLSTISARTLIVNGDRDPLFPVTIPFGLYRAIPRSYLWIVPNGGHLSPLRHSERFAALFTEMALEFLNGAWDE